MLQPHNLVVIARASVADSALLACFLPEVCPAQYVVIGVAKSLSARPTKRHDHKVVGDTSYTETRHKSNVHQAELFCAQCSDLLFGPHFIHAPVGLS